MPEMPLYPTEARIAREVFGDGAHLDEWKGLAVVLEREKMPKIDPLFGRRYWPAVKVWLDVWNRVDKIAAAPPRREGREQWPTPGSPGLSGAPARADNVRPIGSPRSPS
jgi:hypothetical protein